jgi:type VI secretion system protein ImpG
MRDDLYQYYEQELTSFHAMAREFAKKFPKVAGRLHLDGARDGVDPHVERLIQSFALLTSRVRRKIDDEFPEIVESLLNVIYPHYLRPVPPMAIAQFRYSEQQARVEGDTIPADTPLFSTANMAQRCTFRTVYPATILPLQVFDASLGSVSSLPVEVTVPSEAAFALRIELTPAAKLPPGTLRIPGLRFFLNGKGTPLHLLYEMLFVDAIRVCVRSRAADRGGADGWFGPKHIRPVGFENDEGLLPYSDCSFPGYRLLQEYFHFPEKFLFFDLSELNLVGDAGGDGFEVIIFFRDSELRERMPSVAQAVTPETFQLGCTPIVNLFEHSAETIRITHKASEYPVIPDRLRMASIEVYSVDRVTSSAVHGSEPVSYEPFYSFRHARTEPQTRCYWYAHRRPSPRKDDTGTDVYLSLVNLDFSSTQPPSEQLTPYVTCTNRDFVARLPWRGEWGELDADILPNAEIRCLTAPTRTVRAPLRGSLQWRLLSHLSLNHLSIIQDGGLEALQEMLRLYVFNEDEDIRRRIVGITSLTSRPDARPVLFPSGVAFCRGLAIELEFDEAEFAGSGVYLLSAVLERFLALYASINSYTKVALRSRQRFGIVKQWPARIGQQSLI